MIRNLIKTAGSGLLGLALAGCAFAAEPVDTATNGIGVYDGETGTYLPKAAAGQYQIEERTGVWSEKRRTGQRDVPWKAYLPDASTGPAPVVIWSHGLGGSREGSRSLGRYLASHGYAAFHIQHPGTDAQAFKEAGAQGVMRSIRDNPRIVLDRYRDPAFALDEITKMARGDLRGRIDPARAGISGHSFGAITAMTIAGQQLDNRLLATHFGDDRFLAAFIMSPSVPRRGSPREAFSQMLMPIFHLTGTNDGSPIDDTMSPTDRLIPFAAIDNVDQYLLVLEGGTHWTFTDTETFQGADLTYSGIEQHRTIVNTLAVAYWDAHLRGDKAAMAWLRGDGMKTYIGKNGETKFKAASRK